MAIRYPAYTGQTATYNTTYIDISSGSPLSGRVLFTTKATSQSWAALDLIPIHVTDGTNWFVGVGEWNPSQSRINIIYKGDSSGTISNGVTVDVKTYPVVLHLAFDDDGTTPTVFRDRSILKDYNQPTMVVHGNTYQDGTGYGIFDGNGDYLDVGDYNSSTSFPWFVFNGVPFTIDWIGKFSSLPGSGNFSTLIGKSYYGENVNYNFVIKNSGGNYYFDTYPNNSPVPSSAISITTNTRYQMTAQYNGSNTLKYFLNGTLVSTHTVGFNVSGRSKVAIGAANSNNPSLPFTGSMDSCRIVYGEELYSGNFTMSSGELPRIYISSVSNSSLVDSNTNFVSNLNVSGTLVNSDLITYNDLVFSYQLYILQELFNTTNPINLFPTLNFESESNITDLVTQSIDTKFNLLSEYVQYDLFKYIVNSYLDNNSINISDNYYQIINNMLELAEILSYFDTHNTKINNTQFLLESYIANDLVYSLSQLSLTEIENLSAILSNSIQAELASVNVLNYVDQLKNSLYIPLSDRITASDISNLKFNTLLDLSTGIVFLGTVPINGVDYQAWAMNTDTIGITEYTNYPFNSLVTYKGTAYGISDTGLYELNGVNDDNQTINSSILTGQINFGTSRDKSCPRAYLYSLQSGKIILKVTNIEKGKVVDRLYEIDLKDDIDSMGYRSKRLSTGARGVWWQYEIKNYEGSTLELDGVEMFVELRNRNG